MQITNILDSMVKSPLVQQVQERPADIARAQEAAQAPRQAELARQADEVVLQIHETENEGIREEQERKKDFRQNQNSDDDETSEDDETTDAPPDSPPAYLSRPTHRLDVQA